ncbi:hypothetical protein [Cytobacillus oceanisediminis]|uniref:hypothetical protein n=1 Tax=Cytobacillus oceanisediminis TaxID=665099 RepID=UPI00203C84A8|nr:hypothetical protein [Cytobacillus oceanisediminis]MCM3392570.1 hypothetical protein [Cytobacillus oceanisediminis]
MNILSAEFIKNYIIGNRIYNLEIFYIEDYIHVFASYQTNNDTFEFELTGYGGHCSLKDVAIRSAILDLIQQTQ